MKRRSRELNTPDITPLIDVVFLLLIFFMVSTVFKKDELALLLNLPQTVEGETIEAKDDMIIIELSEDELALNGQPRSFETLAQDLEQIEDKSRSIELRIDKDVRYDRVVRLLDKLRGHELTNLSLITDK